MSQGHRSYGPGRGPWMSQQMPGPTPPPAGQGPAAAPHWGWGRPAACTQSSLILPRDRFLKGLLIGAAATYLLTNEQVQRTAIKGVVKAWSLLQSGLEELKERFGDAQAELRYASQRPDSD
ncbi:MAG: hypothetical protein ACUVQI_02650 [Thermochromatium sp.]